MLNIREINADITIGLLDMKAFASKNEILLKREVETSGTAFLLETMLNDNSLNLRYTSANKPYLEGRSEHISISHSHNRLAVIVNTTHPTGIDIELMRDKVLRVRHKFLTAAEQVFAGDDLEKLTSMWGAKEAVYKVYGLKGLDFRDSINVEPFRGDRMKATLTVKDIKKQYMLERKKIEDYMLVYILNEI